VTPQAPLRKVEPGFGVASRFSDVLEQRLFGELSERQAEYTHDIASSGRHLLELVNEILDLSKVEAGKMELEPSELDLADTIRGAVGFVRERAAVHRIALATDVPADLGTIVADERKVRQVRRGHDLHVRDIGRHVCGDSLEPFGGQRSRIRSSKGRG